MTYQARAVFGLLLIAISLIVLWWGSPDRTATIETYPQYAYAFLGLFAVGFILTSMAVLGTEGAYPALLSGFVLYFIVGALLTVFVYVKGDGLAGYGLGQVGSPTFWRTAGKLAALWPLHLVQEADLFGWEYVELFR
jgi:hypothetical protein